MSDEKTAIEKMVEWLESLETVMEPGTRNILAKAFSLLAEERARKPAESKARAYLEGLDDKKGG